MNEGFERLVRESLTGDDNRTWDVFRILALASIVVGFVLETVATLSGKPFDMQGYGIGVGSLLAGAGAALKLNK